MRGVQGGPRGSDSNPYARDGMPNSIYAAESDPPGPPRTPPVKARASGPRLDQPTGEKVAQRSLPISPKPANLHRCTVQMHPCTVLRQPQRVCSRTSP